MTAETAGVSDDESRRRPNGRRLVAGAVTVIVVTVLVQVVVVPAATGVVCDQTTRITMVNFETSVSVDGDRLVVTHDGGDAIDDPDRLSLVVDGERTGWAVYDFDRARASYPVEAGDRFVFANVSVDGRPPRAGDIARVQFRSSDSPPGRNRRWYCYLHTPTQYVTLDEQRLDATDTGTDR
jgi:hypothetical protein